MKKVTLLALAVLASILITFAKTKTDKNDILNNKYIIETALEATTDSENDYMYNDLIKDFDLISEIETETSNDANNSIIFSEICNDFDNYYINETALESASDINNSIIYNSILEDMDTKTYLTQYIK